MDKCKSKGEGGDLCPIVIEQAVKTVKLQATIEKQRELIADLLVENAHLKNNQKEPAELERKE